MSEHDFRFQPDADVIHWKMHFRSAPAVVYRALATAEGRGRFWAEESPERNGVVQFHFSGGLQTEGRILERLENRRFAVEYFGSIVRFELTAAGDGTDLSMMCRNVPPHDRTETIAGWVSVLMAMKAAVDFGVDLRNHDPERTWSQHFADN